MLLKWQSLFPLPIDTLLPQTTKEVSSPKTDGRASLSMTMFIQPIERRMAKHVYSWGHRCSSLLCSSLSDGGRYSEGYQKRDLGNNAEIQPQNHRP